MKRTLLALAITAAAYTTVYASEPFAFLQNGVGTRAAGMGNAYSAVVEEVNASFYNPAGLVRLNDLQLMAETYFMSFDRNMHFIAIGKPFQIGENLYSTGFSWINYNAGSNIEARQTNSPEPDALFSDSTHIFIFTVATKISRILSIGANTKILLENLYEARGTGVGFDIGLLSQPLEELSVAINVMNISTNMNWDSNSYLETFYPNIIGGVSYKFVDIFGADQLNAIISTDVFYSTFGTLKIRAGTELQAYKCIFIRLGFDDAFTMGAGIDLKASEIFSIGFNYAFVTDKILPGEFNHRLSVTLDYTFPHWQKRVEDADGERVKKPENADKIEEEKKIKKKNSEGVEGYDW